MRPLEEQTILVTGSSDGHGKRVAEELAARGATVLVHGRDREKTEAAASEIGGEQARIADLASLEEVRRLAVEIDELDTLVNNAGIISLERHDSADGYELTFAVNYLSHFLLTGLLLPRLREPARIVNVSSIGQERIDFDDLMFERDYNFFSAYARTKLAQVLFTFELAERLGDRDVTVNALHPATLMDTKMVSGGGVSPQSSVEEGAEATVRLVADPDLDGLSGRFFDGKTESGTHRQANDAQARRRLWEESERLTGLA
ncbi:MAG TPA: SDR family NAD(P)-dependent oxidoreductase [Thermoleophilaceae bacterium]|jgi:NAD(P)-dependent dehydrogenase (short-subunit alcohol dehydrogenase family)